mmetsp:Transcript_29303/g.53178  ORF Transcript_29303/g.53178 Transcript_29303/m.53178 type:complete len:279 (-) Transcript_29303:1454-2290(-)
MDNQKRGYQPIANHVRELCQLIHLCLVYRVHLLQFLLMRLFHFECLLLVLLCVQHVLTLHLCKFPTDEHPHVVRLECSSLEESGTSIGQVVEPIQSPLLFFFCFFQSLSSHLILVIHVSPKECNLLRSTVPLQHQFSQPRLLTFLAHFDLLSISLFNHLLHYLLRSLMNLLLVLLLQRDHFFFSSCEENLIAPCQEEVLFPDEADILVQLLHHQVLAFLDLLIVALSLLLELLLCLSHSQHICSHSAAEALHVRPSKEVALLLLTHLAPDESLLHVLD